MADETRGRGKGRKRLIDLLPPGEDEARAALERLFDLARRFPDELPESAPKLLEWLELQVEGEYGTLERDAPPRGKEPDGGGA